MPDCETCNGCSQCGGCSGCGGGLLLTESEIKLLRLFGQIPFLPVARTAGDDGPVFLEWGAPDYYKTVILSLERKGLIDIDYHAPLRGFPYEGYENYPLKGSMGLTLRGQEVLDTLDLQGYSEE